MLDDGRTVELSTLLVLDARRVVLRATVDGVELAWRAGAHRQRALAELFGGWSPRERAHQLVWGSCARMIGWANPAVRLFCRSEYDGR